MTRASTLSEISEKEKLAFKVLPKLEDRVIQITNEEDEAYNEEDDEE